MFFVILGNKIFCFFKKISLFFFARGYISRGESSSAKFWGGSLKKGDGVWKIEKLFGGLGKKGWGQYFRVGLISCRILWWIFGKWFMKMLKKKHSFHKKHVCIYRLQTFWSFMKFYFVNIVKACSSVFRKQSLAYIPLYIHKTFPTLGNEKEQ